MGVPTEGSYKMFDTGSDANPLNTSIRGAQKYDAQDSVNTSTRFSSLINEAQVPLFDERYAGNVLSLDDITKSSQWRGYPADVTCYTCSFEEISDPSIKNITFSCSVLDPQVEFNITASPAAYSPQDESITSPTNGSVTIQIPVGDAVVGTYNNITNPPEQFIGWSYTADGTTGIISNANPYIFTVTDDITIYAIADLSDAVSQEFCYYSPSTGQTTVCESCSTTVTVYFDRDLYAVKPLEDLIWYSNAELTTTANEGQYRQKSIYTTNGRFGNRTRIKIDDTIYYVSGSGAVTPGAANIYKTCTGDFIYCN